MRKKEAKLIFLFFLLILSLISTYFVYNSSFSGKSLTLASWNMQIFGVSKASNADLLESYSEKISNYDIMLIQEIRDSSNTAFSQLCSLLQNYSCEISSRAGRSSSKEQYGIIYKKGINLTEIKDFNPDASDRWERPPIKLTFNVNGYRFSSYLIHTKPDDTKKELANLEGAVSNSGNVLVLGDLNADCSYYSEEKETEFDGWNWLIKNDQDTTISSSDCAYDRIIVNSDAEGEVLDSGIDSSQITEAMSDHAIVWVKLKLE